jgi:hypothetical protein
MADGKSPSLQSAYIREFKPPTNADAHGSITHVSPLPVRL